MESGEDRDELVGDPLVDHQLPGVGSTVEALEADGDIAQVGQRHRARRVPGCAHASADRRADRADGGLEAVLGWWGSRSMVGSRRLRSAAGVGRTWPKPSGRSGSGVAPTRQAAEGLEVGVLVVSGGRGGCCTGGEVVAGLAAGGAGGW